MMEDTGRIKKTLHPEAAKIVFGETADAAIEAELAYIADIDRAHLVMLAEQGIVEWDQAWALIREIEDLTRLGFAPLRGKPAPRGLYLLYEDHLIEKLGMKVGGILQTARSRNDLSATTLKLRLRRPYLELMKELLNLQKVLIEKAREFAGTVMPLFTHYQAAVPITYGHYLAGVATALQRDILALKNVEGDLNRSPLGAGSGGGTSFPINTARTAELLSFDYPVAHSVDAVASRDLVLRILAAAAILGVTLSRLSTDLLQWLGSESKLLWLPDELVGSSSLMPQKRNPFLLEHVQGKSAAPLGAFVAAASAMHKTPFSNSVAVGAEATGHVWEAMRATTEAVKLTRIVIDHCQPNSENMFQVAVDEHTTATAFADNLVRENGLSFREAHRTVGETIRKIEENDVKRHPDEPDPRSVVKESVYGGGPAPSQLETRLDLLAELRTERAELTNHLDILWTEVQAQLSNAIYRLDEESESDD